MLDKPREVKMSTRISISNDESDSQQQGEQQRQQWNVTKKALAQSSCSRSSKLYMTFLMVVCSFSFLSIVHFSSIHHHSDVFHQTNIPIDNPNDSNNNNNGNQQHKGQDHLHKLQNDSSFLRQMKDFSLKKRKRIPISKEEKEQAVASYESYRKEKMSHIYSKHHLDVTSLNARLKNNNMNNNNNMISILNPSALRAQQEQQYNINLRENDNDGEDEGNTKRRRRKYKSTGGFFENPFEGKPPGPIQMDVHYYEMWNHTTNTIQIPVEHRYIPNKRTSLEILQDIIQQQKDIHPYEKDENGEYPQCYTPNTAAARTLADEVKSGQINLSGPDSPVLYVGFPKTGTTTLFEFFTCSDWLASHQQQGRMIFEDNLQWKNISLFDTKWVRMKKNSIIADRRKKRSKATTDINKVAHLQLDTNTEKGYYPQIQLLDEIHQDKPNAVFLMMFRPVDHWIRSANSHHGMSNRWSRFDMPGLIFTEEQRELIETKRRSKDARFVLSDEQLLRWWCGHVQHIREFVKEYPSHRLIELDLLNDEETSSLVADLFEGDSSCWSHHNRNEKITAAK
jgi:hypothetical protein